MGRQKRLIGCRTGRVTLPLKDFRDSIALRQGRGVKRIKSTCAGTGS